MANPEHVEIVKQGKDAIAEWWADNPFERHLDLSDADLSEANLFEVNLSDADLRRANLSKATPGNAHEGVRFLRQFAIWLI